MERDGAYRKMFLLQSKYYQDEEGKAEDAEW